MTRPFTIIDAEQRSDAWRQARVGRATASNAHKILARIGGGKEAADRRNYRVQLILERLTGKPQENTYQNDAMRIGIEREPLAIAAYEAKTGLLIEQTGFLSHTELMCGASLDGHLGDFETLISVKCRQPAAHWEFLRHGVIEARALAQMRHEMFLTGARDHVYVSWQPDFPDGKQLKFVTKKRDELDVPGYEAELLAFLKEIDQELKAVESWNMVKEGVTETPAETPVEKPKADHERYDDLRAADEQRGSLKPNSYLGRKMAKRVGVVG